MTRRAFALPTALLLGAVAIVLIAAMLQRQSAQGRIAQKQLDAYAEHHIARGFNDAVEAWIQSNGSRSIAEALAEDGKAFDLATESGQRVGVWLRPGQGRLLLQLGGPGGQAADDLRRAGVLLRRREPARLDLLTRRDGPIQADAGSAPEPVLRAIADAVLENGSDSFVTELMSKRASKPQLEPSDLTDVFTRADVDRDAQPRLLALLTVTPSVWEYGVEELPRGPLDRETRAYAGLVQQVSVTPALPRGERDTSVQRNSKVLDWWKAEGNQRWWRRRYR